MDCMKSTYFNLYGERDINAIGCVTGKSLNQGGIDGRAEGPGLGVCIGLREICNNEPLCKKLGITTGLKDKKFIIQGLGNVGYWCAVFLCESGAILVGVVESNSSVYNEHGMNPTDIKEYKTKNKTLSGFTGATESFDADSNPAEVLERSCDIIVPSALEKTINSSNASKLKCKIIAEAANGPVTVRAEQILEQKGVIIIPDIVINAGGVTVSYFEWLKNLEHKQLGLLIRRFEHKSKHELYDLLSVCYDKDDVDKLKGPSEKDLVYSGLDEIMSNTMTEVIKQAHEKHISLRMAAYGIAIQRYYASFILTGITI